MDGLASPDPNGGDLRERLGKLERHIRTLRRDLDDTLELIERLRANCVQTKQNLTQAEHEYAALLKELG